MASSKTAFTSLYMLLFPFTSVFNSPFGLDAGREEVSFVNPLVSAGMKMEDDPFRFRGKASSHVEEDYLNYKDSEDLLYDFKPSGEGNVQPLKVEEEDVEILETSTGNEPVAEAATT